ncbi:MAG: hypothetical protein ACRC8Z_10555 [Empedobacter falsenii]
MSGEKSKSTLDWLIHGANWTAIVVVGFATIALICIVYKLINMESSNTAPKEIIVKYEIVVDTIALKKMKDPTILKTVSNIDENNKKILAEINASVDAQYKRMESILEVQEDRSKMFSYGAGFLAILVAIATFFGFKSINEMKKGTIDTAEYEAQKVAEVKAKEVAEEETKKELASKLESIKKELNTSLTSDFKSKIDEKELKASDEFMNSMREEFDGKLNALREELTTGNEIVTPQPSDQIENVSAITENVQSDKGNLYNDEDLK